MMPANVVATFFDAALPEYVKGHAAEVKAIGGTHRFVVTGEGGGEWLLDLCADVPSLETKPPAKALASCVFTASTETMAEIIANPMIAMPHYFAGRLTIAGDVVKATKIASLFSRMPR